MAQANNIAHASRRSFLVKTASLAAGASAVAVIPKAAAAPLDDRALLKLEEQIFDLHEKATAYDAELYRVHQIWRAEFLRLKNERPDMTEDERWAVVTEMPEGKEETRLVELQEPFYTEMDALVKEMFATPAKTSEGRRAKVTVLLGTIMPDDWREVDKDTDYPERMARSLLIELVGGEPGEMLRDQFA